VAVAPDNATSNSHTTTNCGRVVIASEPYDEDEDEDE
jgi:hypothetical protein